MGNQTFYGDGQREFERDRGERDDFFLQVNMQISSLITYRSVIFISGGSEIRPRSDIVPLMRRTYK